MIVDVIAEPSDSGRVVLRSLTFATECLAALSLIGARQPRCFGLGVFRLGPWYMLWSAFSLGLLAIAWRTPPPDAPAGITLGGVSQALTVAGLAVPFWAAGYLLGPGRGLVRFAARLIPATTHRRDVRLRSDAVPWILCGVSIVARLAEILLGHYAYLGDASQEVAQSTFYAQPISQLSRCGLYALLIAAVGLVRRGDARQRLTFAVLLAVEVSFALISGMKGLFVTTVCGVCITFAVARGRVPMRWIIGGLALFLFVVIPYNATYRSLVRGHGGYMNPSSAVFMAPTVLRDTVVGKNGTGASLAEGAQESKFEYLVGRTRSVDSLALVVEMTPGTVPYRHLGELLMAPVLSLVPRAVWPNKPIRLTGYEFGQQYMSMSSQTYTASAVSPQADLYRYGGLLALLVGMGLLGVGHRLIDEAWDPVRDVRCVVVFVPFLFSTALLVDSVCDLLSALPIQLATLFLVLRFAYGGGGESVDMPDSSARSGDRIE
ncbi:hypothetical protein [Frankia canadensis]|nr:hypothetical protein [Frankia canadensis]